MRKPTNLDHGWQEFVELKRQSRVESLKTVMRNESWVMSEKHRIKDYGVWIKGKKTVKGSSKSHLNG